MTTTSADTRETRPCAAPWAILAAALLAAGAAPAAAQSLRAYAGAVAGQVNGPGNCGTYAPSIPNWSAGLTLPIDGIAGCGVLGGEDNHTATTGIVTASQSVAGVIPEGQYTGRAAARAGYGTLGVASQGTITGAVNGGGTMRQSASFASFSDVLTISSPGAVAGQDLLINFGWTIGGTMTAQAVPPYGLFASVALGTQINGRQLVDDFKVIQNGGGVPFYSPAPGFVENNFTLGPGLITGSGRVQSTFFYNVQAGQAFTLEAALRDSVLPCCFGASAETSFLQSAHLSSIRIYTGVNRELADFSITSASGTLYTRDGVMAVPEPGSGALALAGAALLALRLRGYLPWKSNRAFDTTA